MCLSQWMHFSFFLHPLPKVKLLWSILFPSLFSLLVLPFPLLWPWKHFPCYHPPIVCLCSSLFLHEYCPNTLKISGLHLYEVVMLVTKYLKLFDNTLNTSMNIWIGLTLLELLPIDPELPPKIGCQQTKPIIDRLLFLICDENFYYKSLKRFCYKVVSSFHLHLLFCII